jgi:hypothetical protein
VGAPGVVRQPIDSLGRLFVVGLAATFTIAHRLSTFFESLEAPQRGDVPARAPGASAAIGR